MEENIDSGILLRDFISYCLDNHLDQPIIKNINQWNVPNNQKQQLKKILSSVLKINFYKTSRDKLLTIYTSLIKEMDPPIIKLKDITYSNFKLLQSDITSTVYTCLMKNKKESTEIIVKAYPIIYYSGSEENEINILKKLDGKNLNVPKLYPTFKSEHFNCYPMEKIQISLVDLIKQKQKEIVKGLTLDQLKLMLKSIVPILQYLHQELNYLYVDFSLRNIGINNIENDPIFYMFDFGEVEKFSDDTRPVRFTDRYASVKAMEFENISIYDEFESLGFLLLDAHYGPYDSPLGINPTIESKTELLTKLRNGNRKDFFTKYFNTILDIENVYQNLSKLYESVDKIEMKNKIGARKIRSPATNALVSNKISSLKNDIKKIKSKPKREKIVKPKTERIVKPKVEKLVKVQKKSIKAKSEKLVKPKSEKLVKAKTEKLVKAKRQTILKRILSQREKELKKLTVNKLKYRLNRHKLSTIGRKDDLIKRLIEFENKS